MKRGIITFAILASIILNCNAQPNGGFENWHSQFSYEDPDNWQTLNFLSLTSPANPLTSLKAVGIDKHSGNYALKLKTVFLNNNPFPQSIPDTMGYIYTGKINVSPFSYKYGFPYTGRPEKLEFWSKYTPVGGDAARVGAVLLRWNGSGQDTIASGNIVIETTAAYTLFQMNLNYFDSIALPDSATIFLSSSVDTSFARVGSTLFIDDITFTGSVGIEQYDLYTAKVKIFPNPATDHITIHAQFEEACNVKVFDASGKLAGIYKFQNNSVSINTSLFSAGIYLYEIIDKKEKVLCKGKFNVLRK